MERLSLHLLSDDELLRRLTDLLRQSRRAESDLVAHISEVDARKLYAREAAPSMFVYCTEVLHLSEAETYLRIAVARAARAHPLLLDMLADGRLHLSGAGRLAPHLTPDNASALLARATHKTRRQIEELIAELVPRPDAPTVVRKLPERVLLTTPGSASSSPGGTPPEAGTTGIQGAVWPGEPGATGEAAEQPAASRGSRVGPELRPDAVAAARPTGPAVEPLAPGRYKFQFTASATLKLKLERLQALMGPRMSAHDLTTVIEVAVTEMLERLEARHFAHARLPRKALGEAVTAPATRHIPAPVRRAVCARDGHRCRYADAQGRRCSERNRLEFHHRHPFGRGGDHSLQNISLLCPAHNALMAEEDYGRQALARNRGPGSLPRGRS